MQESKRLRVRLEEAEKQLVAAQNERTVWEKETSRCSADLKKSAQVCLRGSLCVSPGTITRATKLTSTLISLTVTLNLQLQKELMERIGSNEEALQNAQNLQKMFEAVKSEYDATSAGLQQIQHAVDLEPAANSGAATP
jgi:multidrug resistance efflux pump